MDGPELLIPLIAIISIFGFLPWMFFHYITIWRGQKTLKPDEERIMEDLWRSAKRMENRIEALEALIDPDTKPGTHRRSDTDYRRDS
ncbi:MAG: envelope stress response membrane protein PspB [Hyphomonadaceae bacterium]